MFDELIGSDGELLVSRIELFVSLMLYSFIKSSTSSHGYGGNDGCITVYPPNLLFSNKSRTDLLTSSSDIFYTAILLLGYFYYY